jgi:YggT family protein
MAQRRAAPVCRAALVRGAEARYMCASWGLSRSFGSGQALDYEWRMFLPANRCPLRRNMRQNPAKAPMRAILDVVLIVLQLYIWLLIAAAVLSWLIAFNVVNTRNPVVAAITDFLYRITEPLLGPIRRRLPNLGGLDISPVVLILIIILIERIIVYYIYPNVI